MALAKRLPLLLTLAAIAAGLALAGCNKPRKSVLTKEQTTQLRDAILTSMPTPQKPVGVIFDQAVELIGVDLSSEKVKPGDTLEVTWYWKAHKAAPGGWMVFVHLEAPGKKRTLHDHHPVGELYPIDKWEAGQIIKDVQRIKVDKEFPGGVARVFVGIFDEKAWNEARQNKRMKVTNKDEVKVPVGNDDRIEAFRVTIDGKKGAAAAASRDKKRPAAVSAAKRYTARKVDEALTIDGKLEERAWRGARPTQAFLTPDGRRLNATQLTQARIVWDDTNLYFSFVCRDDDIYNDLTGRDNTLWEQDVVEIYLDPGADGKDYVEIQVSPKEEIFDAVFTSRRRPKWEEAAPALTLNMTAKVTSKGSVNVRDDGTPDQLWTVEIAIPWKDLPGVDGPPDNGAIWGANLYRIDGKSPTRGAFYAAWSPVADEGKPTDFHNTGRFGKLIFSSAAPPGVRRAPNPREPGGGPAPAPAPKKAAPAPAPAPKEGAAPAPAPAPKKTP